MYVIKIYCKFFKVFVAFSIIVCYTIRVIRNDKYRKVVIMVVLDLFKVLDDTQDVDIYNRKTGVYIFSGESRDITSSCLELHVNKLFANNDLLVIEVE